MRFLSLISGCVFSFCFVVPCFGTTITFSDLRKDAALGVHIDPTGPDNLPIILGGWEVYGSTAAFLNNSVTSRYYSGIVKFDDPISEITFNVERLNDSGWRIPFTVAAYNNRKRVALTTVDVRPLGDMTHVTISAPAINRVSWAGSGWIFHPYEVSNFQVTFLPTSPSVGSGNTTPPSVGSAVPEPAATGLCGVFAVGALLRRRRGDASKGSRPREFRPKRLVVAQNFLA